jgi:hypothetical protein
MHFVFSRCLLHTISSLLKEFLPFFRSPNAATLLYFPPPVYSLLVLLLSLFLELFRTNTHYSFIYSYCFSRGSLICLYLHQILHPWFTHLAAYSILVTSLTYSSSLRIKLIKHARISDGLIVLHSRGEYSL